MYNSQQKPPESGPLPASLSSISAHPDPAAAGADATCSYERCPLCSNFLCGGYYRINGKIACALCAIQARARRTSEKRTTIDRLLGIFAGRPSDLNRLDGPYDKA